MTSYDWRYSREGILHPGLPRSAGTVCAGTLDPAVLLYRFDEELRHTTASSNIENLHRDAKKAEFALIRSQSPETIEFANQTIEALMDALNNYAPDGLEFRAHPGDGADFGWWETTSAQSASKENDNADD